MKTLCQKLLKQRPLALAAPVAAVSLAIGVAAAFTSCALPGPGYTNVSFGVTDDDWGYYDDTWFNDYYGGYAAYGTPGYGAWDYYDNDFGLGWEEYGVL